MPTGTITAINERGFGFIRQDDGGSDLYFHFRELVPGLSFDDTLIERAVVYEIGVDRNGRDKAVGIQAAR